MNSNTACNTPLRAPGRNLWAAASIVFLSVDGSVLLPMRINSISMSDRERERQPEKKQRLEEKHATADCCSLSRVQKSFKKMIKKYTFFF